MIDSISPRTKLFIDYIHELQNTICNGIEKTDGSGTFREDQWVREAGGGGRTRVLSNGSVFEKAGVNTSVVYGAMPEKLASNMGVNSAPFLAAGISLVVHPRSPRVPTVHFNIRCFEQPEVDGWFGGGMDLTPYVADEFDATHFHTVVKAACDEHGADHYPKFKKACDEYFYIKHRKEARGIGGIFYDYLRGSDQEMDGWYGFQRTIGDAFLDSYLPIVERHKNESFNDRELKFQMLRRGRYVEFNLVYDRGTLFGLQTDGRTESILMSLPAVVHFDYDADMEQTESERTLMGWLRQPREWA